MRQHSRLRLMPPAVLSVCLLIFVLTGCMSGDAVLGSFKREFANDPAVAEVDLSSADNMPFTGGVGGTVVLRNSLDDEQLREFANRIVDFRAEIDGDRDESRVRINLAVDEWTFPVLETEEANTALLDVVLALRADPRIRSGTVNAADYRTEVTHATLVAASTTAIADLISEIPAGFASEGQTPSITLRSPDGEQSAVEVSGKLGPWSLDALRGYEALQAEVPVTAFSAEETKIAVTLADERNVDVARTVTAGSFDPAQVMVFFQSDVVALSPGAHGDQAREVLAAVDDEARESIVTMWTDDHSVAFTADSIASVEHLARHIADALGAADFPVTVSVRDGDHTVFSLEAPPQELVADTQTALRLVRKGDVASLRVKPGYSLELDYRSVPSDDDITEAAVALKALSEFDERLCLDWPTSSFCLRTATSLDPNKRVYDDTPSARVFIDAWNTAP